MFIEHSLLLQHNRGGAIGSAQTVLQSCDLIAGAFLKHKMVFRLLRHREKRNENKGGSVARNIPISTENFLDASSKYTILNCGLDKIF